MTRTVAEEVYERVEALTGGPEGIRRAEAIRRVAADTGRTPAAISSAYYSGARRAARSQPDPAGGRTGTLSQHPDTPERSSGHSDAGRLYEQMLPLVEAGGSVEQAARRFGAGDDAQGVAAGFRRWLTRQDRARLVPAGASDDDGVRIVALQAEVRGLRRELARCRQTLSRVRAIIAAHDEE